MSLFVGLDLGGTNLKSALGTETGKIIINNIQPSLADKNQETVFENMFFTVDKLLNEAAKLNETVTAIGIGSPGCIDFDKGQLIGPTPNIKNWENAPIKQKFEERFKIPTFVDNDANLVTLAESRIGAGKDYQNLICLTIGTGIGGGILLDNKVLRGGNYSSAEIGHTIIKYGGRPCNCGNRGCLEAYTSAPAMVDRYRKKLKRTGVLFNSSQINTKFIFEKAALNEDLAKQTIIETCEYLGVGIANAANFIDPEAVIIGGGVADAGAEFIARIEYTVKQVTLDSISKKIKVKKAELGNKAGIVGAFFLASENK